MRKPILCKLGFHVADKYRELIVKRRHLGGKQYHRNYFFCKHCGKRITPFAIRKDKTITE